MKPVTADSFEYLDGPIPPRSAEAGTWNPAEDSTRVLELADYHILIGNHPLVYDLYLLVLEQTGREFPSENDSSGMRESRFRETKE
jgi:hypothetical protein